MSPAEERGCLHVEQGEGGTQTTPQVPRHSLQGRGEGEKEKRGNIGGREGGGEEGEREGTCR